MALTPAQRGFRLILSAALAALPALPALPAPAAAAQAPQDATPPATSRSADAPALELFAVGDWGIDAPDRQTVADAMAAAASRPGRAPAAVLLLGDNFYVKLKDAADPAIGRIFERTYDPARLGVPFYAVLGNEDYKRHNEPAETAYAAAGGTRFKMPARWYRLDLPAARPVVTVLMLDSDQPFMPAADWDAQAAWLGTELAKPHAPWLVVGAHHDLFGNGSHGDNGVLQTAWGPPLKRAGVDFYLCGHEHTLQHLEIPGWPVSFVVAGGGGARRKAMLRDRRGPFSRAALGFADLRFTRDAAEVRLIGGDGAVLHAFARDRAGHVIVTADSPSEKATTHPLKVINDVGDAGD